MTEGRATVERDIEVVVWWQRLLPWMVLLRVLAVVGDEGEAECDKDSPEKPAGEDGGSPEKSARKDFQRRRRGQWRLPEIGEERGDFRVK
ncbi:hypothetical protein Tco_0402613, partial [Tanacetum coccineum]